MDSQIFESKNPDAIETASGLGGSIHLMGTTGEAIVRPDGTAAHKPLVIVIGPTQSISPDSSPSGLTPA